MLPAGQQPAGCNKKLQVLSALSRVLLILLLTVSGIPAASAAGTSGERQLAQALSRSLVNGQVVWLTAAGQTFFGIYTPSEAGKTHGAAVIVPDFGANADWPSVVQPLRSRLPRHGWATLSVQTPIPVSDAPVSAYGSEVGVAAQRIQAAVAYLRQKKLKPIVLVGHGLGGAICARAVASGAIKDIAALVGVGMASMAALQPPLDLTAQLKRLHIPVLDIYGSRDLDRVLRMAPKRQAAAREAGNAGYQQMMVEGAGHGFDDMNDLLIARVGGWMDKHTGAVAGGAGSAGPKETP